MRIFISDSMHLMLFCWDTRSSSAALLRLVMDLRRDAAADTSNFWFASRRVLVFRHVMQQDESLSITMWSVVEMGAE